MLLIGSHIDSVSEDGNYDGEVGSLSAIEVAQRLNENSIKLRHSLQVIMFQNEEDGHIGTRALGVGLDDTESPQKSLRRDVEARSRLLRIFLDQCYRAFNCK